MTPEQEDVYYNWKRVFWTSAVNEIPAVVVLQDRDSEKNYCVWAQQSSGAPSLKFFSDITQVHDELVSIGLKQFYPCSQLP